MTRYIKAPSTTRNTAFLEAGGGLTTSVMPASDQEETLSPSVAPALPEVMNQIRRDLATLQDTDIDDLRSRYRLLVRRKAPPHLPRWLLLRIVAYRLQASAIGDLDAETVRYLDRIARDRAKGKPPDASGVKRAAGTPDPDKAGIASVPYRLRPGTQLIREHDGELHKVTVLEKGFSWKGQIFTSLSEIARTITGTNWNGPAFFGLRPKKHPTGHANIDVNESTGAVP